MLLSNGQGHGPSGFLLHPFTGIFDHLSMGIFDPHSRCFVWVRAYVCLVNRWLWNSKKSSFCFQLNHPWRNNRSCFKLTLSPLLGLVIYWWLDFASDGAETPPWKLLQSNFEDVISRHSIGAVPRLPSLEADACWCKGCLWCGCFIAGNYLLSHSNERHLTIEYT